MNTIFDTVEKNTLDYSGFKLALQGVMLARAQESIDGEVPTFQVNLQDPRLVEAIAKLKEQIFQVIPKSGIAADLINEEFTPSSFDELVKSAARRTAELLATPNQEEVSASYNEAAKYGLVKPNVHIYEGRGIQTGTDNGILLS